MQNPQKHFKTLHPTRIIYTSLHYLHPEASWCNWLAWCSWKNKVVFCLLLFSCSDYQQGQEVRVWSLEWKEPLSSCCLPQLNILHELSKFLLSPSHPCGLSSLHLPVLFSSMHIVILEKICCFFCSPTPFVLWSVSWDIYQSGVHFWISAH